MKFCVLGSGSKGNATYLESGETSILIDAGMSGIELQRRLATIGVELSKIDAILVTHEHNDHVHGVGVLSRRASISVHANPATFSAASKTVRKLFSYNEFETGVSFQIRNLEIHPFAISHDAHDPVGFRISDGRVSFGYCTDTGKVSQLIRSPRKIRTRPLKTATKKNQNLNHRNCSRMCRRTTRPRPLNKAWKQMWSPPWTQSVRHPRWPARR